MEHTIFYYSLLDTYGILQTNVCVLLYEIRSIQIYSNSHFYLYASPTNQSCNMVMSVGPNVWPRSYQLFVGVSKFGSAVIRGSSDPASF